MLTISFKLLLYLAVATLLLGGCAIWYVARQRPLFDRQFRGVWNVSPFGVVLLSALGGVLFVNRHAQVLLGVDGADAADDATLARLMEQLDRRSAAQHFSVGVDGGQTLDVWSGRFGRNRLLILRDLSAQRRQEQETQVLWSNIAHELRTPMTSMLSHLEIARQESSSAELRDESLTIVQQQAERLTHLVQNSLELGRLKATALTDMTLVDMVLVVEEAIAELILLAERQDNSLTLVCDETALMVFGNRDKLKQVLVNLLGNSLKYCLAGDTITVKLHEADDLIVCAVEDTGNGIPAQHLARITEQFYRADRQQPGSGLGLAIVQEIVRQHGGKLHIDSAVDGPEKGTRVSVSLPKSLEKYPSEVGIV